MLRSFLRRGPFLVILVCAVAAAGAIAAIAALLRADANTELLLDKRDRDLTYYSQSRRDWPSDDEFAIVCCRRADWFTAESLALLREIERACKAVPHTAKVLSLFDVPLLRQSPLPLPRIVDAKGVDLAKAKAELTDHALAKGTLISDDGEDAVLLVYLEKPEGYDALDKERTAAIEAGDEAKEKELEPAYEAKRAELRARRAAFVEGVRAVAREFTPRLDGPVRLSGLPIINVNLIEHVNHDVNWFGAASLLLFTAGFAAMYRRLRWTVLPIATCALPVLLSLAYMALRGEALTVITANMPLLLFVIMLPYTVYFVERYRERRAANPGESQAESTVGAAEDIWLPCFYSCVTTMMGFFALYIASSVRPVESLGEVTTIGLGLGLVCVFLFLPSTTLRMRPLADAPMGSHSEPSGIVRVAERIVLRRPGTVVAAAAVLLAFSFWGITKLTSENKFIDYFKPTSEVYVGLEHIDQQMGGTTPLDIVLTAKEPGFFRTEKGLDAIRAASDYVANDVKEVGSVTSLATLLGEARKAAAFSRMPEPQILRLAEGMKDLKPLLLDVATADYAKARILVRFRETAPTLNRKRILDGLRADLAKRPELAQLESRVTGVFLLYSNMLQSLIHTRDETSAWVSGTIFTMLVMLLGGFAFLMQYLPPGVRRFLQVYAGDDRPTVRGTVQAVLLAVLVIIPQALPAVVCLGVMGWTGVPLDLITVTIAAIAMGVGDDSAIQYTVRYRVELATANGDRRAAVTLTHATIGRAIWIATTIMVVGFAVLMVSDFAPTVMFGVFTALAMLMGQFASLTLLPSLFLLTGLPRR